MGILLSGENVRKVYQGVVALDNINFQVEEGDIVGLIGPNGAGKTTLLSCISGTEKLSGGNIYYRGASISYLPVYQRTRLGISRTFQIVQPFKGMTVLENVIVSCVFAGRYRRGHSCKGVDFGEPKKILQRCGLEKKKDMYANELELSEQKRLEFARALATNPELILLDEVMSGLNRVEMESILDLVRMIQSEGVTIILVEHIMKAVTSVSKKLIVLNYGKKLAEDVPEKVLSNPEVIKAYLGVIFEERKKSNLC